MSVLLAAPTSILLTGASSGIGKALARQLVAAGHGVVVVSRKASNVDGTLAAYPCDLSDPAGVIELCGTLKAIHPEIGIVINNAAVQHDAPLAATTPSQVIEEAMVNLVAPALIAQAFLPMFQRRSEPSATVNVSSGLAYFPKRSTSLYCATKAGLHSLSQSLRYQCDGSGTLVCEAILPLVATPMIEGRGTGKLEPDAVAGAIIEGVKAGRSEIFVGKARLLPLLQRVAPSVARSLLRGR